MSLFDFITWFLKTAFRLAIIAGIFGGGYYYVTSKTTQPTSVNGKGTVGGGIGGIGNGNSKGILTP